MPTYLHKFEIDWGWTWLSERERTIVRKHHARASSDPRSHTLQTLMEALADASRELGGRQIPARAEDVEGRYLLLASGGNCSQTDTDLFSDDGVFPEQLTVDDYRAAGVTTLAVGLYFPDELLALLTAEAARLDCSLSRLIQTALKITGDRVQPSSGGNGLPKGGQRRLQTVYLPVDLNEALGATAAREDRSKSWLVQQALAAAWPTIQAMSTLARNDES